MKPVHGKHCDLAATPLMTEFAGSRRVLVDAPLMPVFGRGVVLGSGVIVNRGVERHTYLGDGVMVWHNSIVGHDCVIGARTVVGVGCVVSGAVTIGEDCYIAPGSVIQPRCKIGSKVIVGSLSNVMHDTVIPDGEAWWGDPAKFKRKNEWRPPT